MTNGERYGPAMEITDQGKADEYFEFLVEDNLARRSEDNLPQNVDEAKRIERSNLGYYAGYYSNETRARVERLFKCEHPILGKIADNGAPTTRESLAAGMVAATQGIKAAAKLFK